MEPIQPEEKKSNGAFLGIIIIVIILIAGGIYIWQTNIQTAIEDVTTKAENQFTPTDVNEINTLEQDLDTLDTNIDIDLNTIN